MKTLEDIPFFRILQQIPYENVSKILRLKMQPEERPRDSRTLLSDFRNLHFGGTCFSLVNLLIRSLEIEGIRAYPVKAEIHRRSFPHFFGIVEHENKRYLVDPGYLINQPVEIIPGGNSLLRSGAIDFTIKALENETYQLQTQTNGTQTTRYTFRINPLDLTTFMHYWIRSFDYINAIVASRFVDEKFIYINDDYVQIRSKGNVEKYKQREKAHACLKLYFDLDETMICTAEELLKDYLNKNSEARG
ncbi:MAG: arylamine N-acetyltransferase [Candidatus Neomarinimicrobiota bacterium]|jgi:arylamine N-acetyltransferase|nr:arylamine N-acetyltransferase [Candidatus Neomarinimicrobiota bacterium]MDD3965560.1 arylamine N-acetyltransferase [Candidatus Neomarinimicrobiota bacterium]MDX9781258.1 arylamine N-acetyltransferase [bacterium]